MKSTLFAYAWRVLFNAGKPIADTSREFNLSDHSPNEGGKFPGPFRYAGSQEKADQKAIAQVVRSEMVFVAEDDEDIVGVLKG